MIIITAIKRIVFFVVLVLLQVVLFDKIHLFGCATPLLYVYFIVKLPDTMKCYAVTLLSALLGLCIDVFDCTLGLNTLACVITGFSHHYIIRLFIPCDGLDTYTPSFKSPEIVFSLRYAFLITLVHHTILFIVESLSFLDPISLVSRIVGSIALTMFLIFILEHNKFRHF